MRDTLKQQAETRLAPTGWNPVNWGVRKKAVSKHVELTQRDQLTTQEERQRQYDAARISLLGDMSNEPPEVREECPKKRKARTRRERRALTDAALASGCPLCRASAARLRNDMDEIENMRCAKHVYVANDPNAPPELRDNPPPGFINPNDQELAEMGLTRDMLTPEGTNFRAAVYVKDPEIWAPPNPPDPRTLIAFRGSTPHLEDWENNMMQGVDSTPGYKNEKGEINQPYYKRAVEIGSAVGRSGQKAHLVGHSLGGGLASAAQGASGGTRGLNASTYNAAGLHPDTVARYGQVGGAPDSQKISAIRVKGEVLTKMQEDDWTTSALMDDAVGKKRDLQPAHDLEHYQNHQKDFDRVAAAAMEEEFKESAAYSTYLHGMDEVIASMEAQKQADQAILKSCASSSHSLPSGSGGPRYA